MILYVCYNENCRDFKNEVENLCEKYPRIELISYNEDHYQEKKKAYKVKGGYSARMTPFALLLHKDKTYIKAFYSEDKSCNLDSLKTFLSNHYENS